MCECHNCGRRFEEPDIVTEPHGEKVGVCPFCHGYYEAVYPCRICGEHFTDDELTSGVCDECIYEDVTIDRCIRYGEYCEEKVQINGFISSILDIETINKILIEEVKKASQIIPIDLDEFVDSDKSWWAEQLIKDEENEDD